MIWKFILVGLVLLATMPDSRGIRAGIPERAIMYLFGEVDLDSDKLLDPKEAAKALSLLRISPDYIETQMDCMMNEVGAENNKITKPQFYQMMRNLENRVAGTWDFAGKNVRNHPEIMECREKSEEDLSSAGIEDSTQAIIISETDFTDDRSTDDWTDSTTETTDLSGEGNFKVVCYFTNWPGYTPEDIDPTLQLCTHVVYGFAVLDPRSWRMDVSGLIDNEFMANMEAFQDLGIKVSLAIGGWNDSKGDKYSRLVEKKDNRYNFIKNVIEVIGKHNFDGLDLNWEFPVCWQNDCTMGRYSDKRGFSDLVRELREAFEHEPKRLLLSAAVSPIKEIIDVGYDVQSIANDLDWISVMTYDYHGHWDRKTGHVAPLFANSEFDENPYFNANFSINEWIERGAPPSKLVMGMPFHGQTFTLRNEEVHSLNAPIIGKGNPGEFTQTPGILAYSEICGYTIMEGWPVVQDPRGTYAYGGNQWVSYDDIESMTRKSHFIRGSGLGGGMVRDVALDDFKNICRQGKYPLLKAINGVLRPHK